jgi:hypothetical protein
MGEGAGGLIRKGEVKRRFVCIVDMLNCSEYT